VALTVGGARESMDRLLQTMRSAKAAGGIADYREIEALSIEFGTHIGDIVNFLRLAEATPGLRRELVHAELTAVSSHLVADARELWTMMQGRLDGLLTKRHDQLWRQMYMMAGGSLLAALIGIGSAIRMFQSTLRKLDEVELAREQEGRARAEAEDASARLEVINADIAKLNVELSANMAQLRDAQEEITRKGRMEQLGQLTATVAHELRNPLGAVRTSAFLLQRKLKDNALGVEPQLLRINNGIMRCDDIIAQLLDFSRSTAAVKEPVELDDWLIATIEEQAESIPSAVEIVLQPGLGGLQVAADGARLSRVVSNLLNNAAEALVGRGDDPSKFTTSHPKITVETRLSARGAEILVKDNGPGISPEDMPRIMEPLFTTKSFGTGLGLPAVNRILEQHGGGLDIGNNPEGGACFTAWIPVAEQERSAA
jgi:signal transduction histidine kinase